MVQGFADVANEVEHSADKSFGSRFESFVAKGNGRFEPVAVMTGDTREGWTVINQGLKPGDSYVREGAFALKARLLRSQLGEH